MKRLTGINSNFQIFGWLNFFSSLLILIFVKEADFIDKLIAMFAINAGYFIYYFLIGKMI
ncbi:hypothetical protein SAMN04488034_1178 [Salinimicrobium catena]|uniref:Uncharacterized protein n=1 Tax=Salinimicrobium catena TaxID=390640 RepID=A0A1H5PGE8_9FLAO|nr:hypothetical protein SAMN04488140_1178 [Salinimicrobium catena]SEF12953.1 hypothetical protein SAMN04488034_1178 [Salinimicrobium catena]